MEEKGRMYKAIMETEEGEVTIFTCFVKKGKCKFAQAKVLERKPGYCICCRYTENGDLYVCPYTEKVRVHGDLDEGPSTSYCTYPI